MNNNQDNELVVLIQDVIAGNAEKKELCNRIYKEVYALAYPVYQDEEKSMTQAKKALIEVCNRIEDINLSKNVHKQVATIVSAYFFVSAVSEYEDELKNDYVMREYNYSRIREDEELLGYMKKKAGVFRSPKVFDEEGKDFTSLNPVQMALMELYAYEMQSVEAIERITDVDSSYIASWIAGVKETVIEGYEVVAATPEEALSQTQDSENVSEEAYEEPAYEELQEDEAIDYNDVYEEKKAVSAVYKRASGRGENSVTMFIKKIFPELSLPVRNIISWAVGCVVVIVLVSVLFVSVIAAKNNKKKVSKDYDYQDMQYYTTKQASTKEDTTEEGSGDNTVETEAETEATTEEKTTTQKETESSQQATTQRNNNDNNNNNRNTTAADAGDDSDSGNSTSDDSDSSDNGSSGSDDSGSSDNGSSGSNDNGSSDNGSSGSNDNGSSDNGSSGSNDNGSSNNGSSGSDDSGNGNSDNGSSDSKGDSSDDSKSDDNTSDFGGGIIKR